LIADLF
jgi:hypothetical protein